MVARQINYVSFHFTPYIGVYDRQTDKIRFISFLILGFKEDRRTTYVSFNPQSTQDKRTIEFRQTDNLFFTPDIGIDARPTNYVSFYPLCWHLWQTDGQNTFHFTPHIWSRARETYKFFLFHSSYCNPRKTNYVAFNPQILIYARQTDNKIKTDGQFFFTPDIGIDAMPTAGQTMFHFTHYVCIYDRQTDKIRFISLLVLTFKEDRRTTYVSFNPQSTQDKRTIELTQTDKLFFKPRYWNRRKTNRRTNYVSFHPLCWHLWQTDGQNTFHFTPHIGIQGRQTDNLRFI